jgi:phospholipase/lecithinase/hemolysin
MKLSVVPSSLRRITVLAAALAASALLVSCGGSTAVFEPLVPPRIIAMGDGLADLGQVGGVRYTVNDGSNNTWVQQVAANYGLGITAQAAGGQGWARGNARVVLKPDAAGSSSTLTITEQVDAFLAANVIAKNDIILLDAGLSDLWVQAQNLKAGSITEAQALLNAAEAGKALGALARRVVAAGGTHVVVAQTYNLGKSPYAIGLGLASAMENASLKYNEALKVSIVDLGANVLTIDSAYRYNLMINQPGNYGFSNATTAACTTPDASTCTASTANSAYATYVFADDKYFTPAAQRSFGDYAYNIIKSRW